MTTQFTPLAFHDLQTCLIRAPHEVLFAMKKFGAELFVAGGFVRSCVANEPINDVDLFCSSKDRAMEIAKVIATYGHENRPNEIFETDNAYTVKGFRYAIQVIHRWTFTEAKNCIESFDFTIARGAFWWSNKIIPTELKAIVQPDGTHPIADLPENKWYSLCDVRFYQDLASKRLTYCQPVRNEDAGGSLLRVLKFYQRGFRIPLDDMGAVLSRLMMGVRMEHIEAKNEAEWFVPIEHKLAEAITKQLRMVDPEIDPRHIAHLPSAKETYTP